MKRFTETLKWSDPWFRKLSPPAKLLWAWLTDCCDAAGIIDPDLELAAFQTGLPMSEAVMAELGDRIERLPCGKFHIPSFVEFQVGVPSTECKAHRPIFQSWEKHHIQRESKGYRKGMDTVQDTDKDKDKDKDGYGGAGGKGAGPCTLDQAKSAAAGCGLTGDEAEFWWKSRASDDWMKGSRSNRRPVGPNWQHEMSTFTQSVRETRARSGSSYAPPQRIQRAVYTDELPQL